MDHKWTRWYLVDQFTSKRRCIRCNRTDFGDETFVLGVDPYLEQIVNKVWKK